MKSPNRILLLVVAISLLFIIAGVTSAVAQSSNEPTGFKSVHLWIFPEYDDPRLLVMLEGQIEGIQPPAKVRFLVPSAAEMYSAGSMDVQGKYSGGPPDRKPSSIPGWDEISYEVTTDTFRMEYYDPAIRGLPDKTISYQFLRLYPISDLEVVVQEPRRSSNFSVIPRGEPFIDNEGFSSYRYDYRDLKTEPSISFEIKYTKPDSNPSLVLEEKGSSNTLLIVVLTFSLCIIVGGGLYWAIKSKSRKRPTRRRATGKGDESEPENRRFRRRFCSQCGERLEKPSRFCPNCGTQL